MIVVSDTTPLSNLLQVNRLDLLPALYEDVFMPLGVAEELLALEAFGYTVNLAQHEWLRLEQVSLSDDARYSFLDRGEREALMLAQKQEASLLLMDEKKGREVASSLGFKVRGTLGVLMEAKMKGLLTEIKPEIEKLKSVGFWLHPSLEAAVLKQSNEL